MGFLTGAVIRQMYPPGPGQLEHPEASSQGMEVVAATPVKLLGGGAVPQSKINHFWVERLMEARSFEGKNPFWRPEVGKKHNSHNYYLKKYTPHNSPQNTTTKKPLLPTSWCCPVSPSIVHGCFILPLAHT